MFTSVYEFSSIQNKLYLKHYKITSLNLVIMKNENVKTKI